MNLISKLRNEEGFTIQELMVVLIVGSLLVSFSFSLFLFGQKLFGSWQKKTEVRTSVSRALQAISLDILQSKYVSEVSDTVLVLTKKSDVSVRYRFDGKHVWRNAEIINANKEISLAVSILRTNVVQQYPPLLHIRIEGTSPAFRYVSEGEVSPPLSSRANFLSEMK